MVTDTLLPAFGDPVHASQRVFRSALAALAEPGTLQEVHEVDALDGLAPATHALCLTLLDGDTPLWLAPELDTPQVRANLAFHVACPIVRRREEAAFAVLSAQSSGRLDGFEAGTDRDPHLSCTLIVQLEGVAGGTATTWRGPGIAGERRMHLPLPAPLWRERLSFGFPRGLDMFFTAGRTVVGLPRSTQVSPAVQGVN